MSKGLQGLFCPTCLSDLVSATDAPPVLYPTQLPPALRESHRVCPACLAPHPFGKHQEQHCNLGRAGLHVSAVGWSSRTSEALRHDLRKADSVAMPLLEKLLQPLVEECVRSLTRPVLVAVPTSGRGGDPLADIGAAVAATIGIFDVRAVSRDKRESTRSAVAQKRRMIVEDEYSVVGPEEIAGRQVILMDDLLVTGITLVGLARKLLEVGADGVIPVVLERHVSARFGQRLDHPLATCSHQSSSSSH